MTGRKIEYGLIETHSPHIDNLDCSGDHEFGDLFCHSCGVCVRYERKKASQRESLGLPDIKINGE
jgi:hypothetical protein